MWQPGCLHSHPCASGILPLCPPDCLPGDVHHHIPPTYAAARFTGCFASRPPAFLAFCVYVWRTQAKQHLALRAPVDRRETRSPQVPLQVPSWPRTSERERERVWPTAFHWLAGTLPAGSFCLFFRKLRLAAVQAICEHHHFISSQIKIYLCLRQRSGKSTGICGTYLNPSKTLVVLFYLFDRSTSQHRNICLLFVFVAHRPKNLFCRMPCVFSTHQQGTFKIYSSTPPLCTPAFLFPVGEMADCSELNNHSPRLVTAHISDGGVNVY